MAFIEERISILEVIAQYSYTYDARDSEGFADLFMEDGVWEYYFPGQNEPEIKLNSRHEIREWAANRLKGREGVLISRHHQTGTVFDILQSDSAESRTMVLVTHHDVDEPYPAPTLSGVYYDTWQKTPDGWKFSKRVLYTDKLIS